MWTLFGFRRGRFRLAGLDRSAEAANREPSSPCSDQEARCLKSVRTRITRERVQEGASLLYRAIVPQRETKV